MAEQSPSFEEALEELEQAVARLEQGGLTLEEALALFERGIELAALCEKALDEAELRLEKLRPAGSGAYEAVPFGDEAEG